MLGTLEALIALAPTWVLANHAVPCPGTALLEANLQYLEGLQDAARQVLCGRFPSMEEAFPYRWTEAADFYREVGLIRQPLQVAATFDTGFATTAG